MALIRCHECKARISAEALTCPKCGAPPLQPSSAGDGKPKGMSRRSAVIVTGFIVVGFCALVSLSNNSSTNEANKKASDAKTCVGDWKKCANNADLIQKWNGYAMVRFMCHAMAEKSARYGTPQFPLDDFEQYIENKKAFSKGIIAAVEPDALFENAFGVMVHSTVSCVYAVGTGMPLSISVTPNR